MSKNTLTTLSHQWQPYLSWFDATLQPIMAELLSQLYLMLGPIKENDASNNDWHSGLGEIKSRGHYENLLLSEWLLFEDEPDEFLRRAVTHEHLFLAPTPEEQKSNNAIIALFDEGILQLGHMRLVHLVMMLLLAHRAYKQQSQFYWGIIQQPAELHAFSGLDSLLDLLNNRSLSAINSQTMDNWSIHLEGIVADERWFIGAKMTMDTISLAKPLTHHVYINRHTTEQRKLNISILGPGNIRHSVVKLPNEIVCAKILLGQLAPNSNYADLEYYTVVPIATTFPPIVSMNGNNVAALTQEQTHLLICSLVDTLSAKQKCKATFSAFNGEPLALDFQNKKIIGLIKYDSQVWIWQPNRALKLLMIPPERLDITATKYTQFMWIYDDQGQSIYLIDKNHTLWHCYINKQPQVNNAYELVEVDKNVLSLFKLSDSRCAYTAFNEKDDLRLKSPQLKHIDYLLPDSQKAITQLLIADEKNWLSGFGIIAFGIQQEWQILTRDATTSDSITLLFTIPAEWTVWGLLHRDNQTRVLLIHHDRKKIATLNPDNNDIEEIHYSPNTIAQYHFCSLSNTFALITANREITLYAFATDSVRLIIKNKDVSC